MRQINNVSKVVNPIFRDNNVNTSSICLECEREKSMQLLMEHMKMDFLHNGCK